AVGRLLAGAKFAVGRLLAGAKFAVGRLLAGASEREQAPYPPSFPRGRTRCPASFEREQARGLPSACPVHLRHRGAASAPTEREPFRYGSARLFCIRAGHN